MKKRHKNVTRREAKERRALARERLEYETAVFNRRTGFNLSPEEYKKAQNDFSTDDENEPPFIFLLEQARALGLEDEFLEGYKKVHGEIPHGEVIIGGSDMEEVRFSY